MSSFRRVHIYRCQHTPGGRLPRRVGAGSGAARHSSPPDDARHQAVGRAPTGSEAACRSPCSAGGQAPGNARDEAAADPAAQRRRPRLTERDRHGERPLRQRPGRGGLRDLRGRGEAGNHVLLSGPAAHRARDPARHERQHERAAGDGTGSRDRLRPEDAAGGRHRGDRLRQPGAHPADVHQRRRGAREGDSVHGRQRIDLAVQRDLRLAEGAQARQGELGGRDPPPGHRRPLRRRRYVEPRALRRSARSGQAIGDGDLRHRAASERLVPERVQGSGVRAQAALAGNGRARVLRPHGGRAAEDLRADFRRTGQSVQPRVFLEEPDAQRRLAQGRRASEPSRG